MSLEEFIKLVQSFEGIIGAVLGVVATLIVTHILKNTGKISSRVTNVKTEYFSYATGFENNVVRWMKRRQLKSIFLLVSIIVQRYLNR
ncbi:hypothetical protein QUF84_00270 [Fictibacillus enclensis]|uniref:hypothetical protein n=1 Tax=Fictibacillus enclensis TaxID=1017270 RepID=UPI0025A07D69|nr:hypothetical protein [Fictibacillus enclensis]MDM5335731.1 hypothetical protein [Fictibacillus enclensis]